LPRIRGLNSKVIARRLEHTSKRRRGYVADLSMMHRPRHHMMCASRLFLGSKGCASGKDQRMFEAERISANAESKQSRSEEAVPCRGEQPYGKLEDLVWDHQVLHLDSDERL
jgi:hypothetical protein